MTPEEADDLANRIGRLFVGHDQVTQGVALADLLATWLVSHPPDLREELLQLHISAVYELVAQREDDP